MKEKLLSQLIVKYPGVSKKFLGLLAEKQSTKVTDETQIEVVINELENLPISVTDLAAEWQKEGDARVNEAKKEWVKNPPKPDKPPKTDPPPNDPPPADEMPSWAKGLLDTVNSLKAEKEQQSLTEKLSKHEKLKDIPAKFYNKRVMPKTDEEIEAFAEEAAADYAELIPVQTEQTFRPGVGSKTKTSTAPTKEEISSLTAAILPK